MQFREDDEMSTAPDTNDTAQASDTCAPAKRPGRPRTAEQPLTPAQRQKLYKQRKQAQAEQLQRAAEDVESAAVDDDPAKLTTAPRAALLRVLEECLDALDKEPLQWRRNVARRLLAELERRYQLNREDDETVGED